jgi:hypothetical protein
VQLTYTDVWALLCRLHPPRNINGEGFASRPSETRIFSVCDALSLLASNGADYCCHALDPRVSQKQKVRHVSHLCGFTQLCHYPKKHRNLRMQDGRCASTRSQPALWRTTRPAQ